MREKVQMFAAGTVLVLIALGAPPAPAAQHEHGSSAAPQADMMSRPMAMNDGEVAKLTEEMNHATGQTKIDAMAKLLTVLVQDRAMMLDQMKTMQHMHEMMMQGGMHRGDANGEMTHPSAPAK